jgi:MFS family permease
VVSGLRSAWTENVIRSLLFVALIPLIIGMSYQPLLAVFAKDVLDIGSVGLGMLVSAAGIGAIAGNLTAATFAGALPRGTYMFGGIFIFGVALIAFANSTIVPLSLACLVFIGIGSSSYQSVNNTLIQEHSPDSMRGRIMSLLFLERGLIPLGSLVGGVGIELFGAEPTMTVFGITMILLGVAAAIANPAVRRLA